MITDNKMTTPHKEHEVIVKRAEIDSPHYGYYHCVTCNKFITWIDQNTYRYEKKKQLDDGVMWFGVHQGLNITDLPQGYLEWVIENVQRKGMEKLHAEWHRRNDL